MINYNPKDVYEGQVAVYVHYKSPISVAVALRVSLEILMKTIFSDQHLTNLSFFSV